MGGGGGGRGSLYAGAYAGYGSLGAGANGGSVGRFVGSTRSGETAPEL